MRFNNKTKVLESTDSPVFSYSDTYLENQNYSIAMVNQYLKNKDSLVYTLNVIPDAYPLIDVDEHKDSINVKHYYFKGIIKDDYGFSRLTFNYKIIDKDDSVNAKNKTEIKSLPIDLTVSQEPFYYFFDITQIPIDAGQELEYYFEVWDNDGVSDQNPPARKQSFTKSQQGKR